MVHLCQIRVKVFKSRDNEPVNYETGNAILSEGVLRGGGREELVQQLLCLLIKLHEKFHRYFFASFIYNFFFNFTFSVYCC